MIQEIRESLNGAWCPTSVERSVGLSTPPMTRHDPSILPPWLESLLPRLCCALPNPQRPHRPAEIITVHCEVGNGLMHLRILGETVTLANFSCVSVPVSAVVPFHEGCVDRFAHQRHSQCRLHRFHGNEHYTPVDLHHPPFLAGFLNCCVG